MKEEFFPCCFLLRSGFRVFQTQNVLFIYHKIIHIMFHGEDPSHFLNKRRLSITIILK